MRSTAKRLHDVLVFERLLRPAFEDDLAAVDRVEPVRDARRVDVYSGEAPEPCLVVRLITIQGCPGTNGEFRGARQTKNAARSSD